MPLSPFSQHPAVVTYTPGGLLALTNLRRRSALGLVRIIARHSSSLMDLRNVKLSGVLPLP